MASSARGSGQVKKERKVSSSQSRSLKKTAALAAAAAAAGGGFGEEDEDEDGEDSSQASSNVAGGGGGGGGGGVGGGGGGADFASTMSEAMEQLSDKRATTRCGALVSILALLRGAVAREAAELLMESFVDTANDRLLKLFSRTPSLEEGKLGLEVLCLLALFTGPDEDAFFDKFQASLSHLVLHSDEEELQTHALFSLAFISFICSDASNICILTFVEDVLCEVGEAEDIAVSEALKKQASQSWLLLAGIMDNAKVADRSKARMFEAFTQFLEDATEVDSKVSVGEALAFLYEVADKLEPNSGNVAQLSALMCEDVGAATRSLAFLQTCAREGSKHVSKRDKKEQRKGFRDVEAWIFNGEPPSESVRMQGADVLGDSFHRLRILDDLRRVLGDGFQKSTKNISVVRDVLGIEELTGSGDEGDRQVRKGSKLDKTRSVFRKQDRHYKNAETFFEDDDD